MPETIGGERNWDYRYTWIRDGTFMLWGFYTLGFAREANDFFYFIADVATGQKDLQIMYGIAGEHELAEKTLDHLSGYDGSRPVRIGNDAYRQQQHDVWGAVLDSVYLHTKSRDYMPELVWPILKRSVEQAIENWKLPDRGIWEVRGEPQHFTSSKLVCWVALDRGARLAELHGDGGLAVRWQAIADEIKEDICTRGVDSRGVFVQHYGTTGLDASVLLIPLVRFLPPEDPRVKATVLAIAEELTVDGAALPDRGDGRWAPWRGGHVHDLLVLAGVGARGDRRAGQGSAAVREAFVVREPAPAVCRGDRPAERPPPGQLPAGLFALGPDQRGHACNQRGTGRYEQVRRDRSGLTAPRGALGDFVLSVRDCEGVTEWKGR